MTGMYDTKLLRTIWRPIVWPLAVSLCLATAISLPGKALADDVLTTFEELIEQNGRPLDIALMATTQAYVRENLSNLPKGALVEIVKEEPKLGLRVIIVRDTRTDTLHFAIRGTTVEETLSVTGAVVRPKQTFYKARNIVQDLGVMNRGFLNSDLTLLERFSRLTEEYRKTGQDDPETIETAQRVCARLSDVKAALPSIATTCGVLAGGAVGYLLGRSADSSCLLGAGIGAVLGGTLVSRKLPEIEQSFHRLLDQELLEAFAFVFNVFKEIRNNPQYRDYKIEISGHSLGGYLATLLGLVTGNRVWAFSAPGGAASLIQDRIEDIEKIMFGEANAGWPQGEYRSLEHLLSQGCATQISNIKRPGDVIASFGTPCGRQYLVEGGTNESLAQYLHSRHSLDSIHQEYLTLRTGSDEFPHLNKIPVRTAMSLQNLAKRIRRRSNARTGANSSKMGQLETDLDESLERF